MPRKNWMPTALPDLLVMTQNFMTKIDGYATVLGLTPLQVGAAQDICEAIIGAINSTDQCRTTMQAMSQWRASVLTGEPVGSNAAAAPVFPVVGAVVYKVGTLEMLRKLRDQIVASPGYTLAIGEDLGIVGVETSRPAPSSVTPDLRAETSTGYWVNLSGSMQGMDALKVEYSRNGSEFTTVAFLTNTPGGFQITPTTPNQPEKGFVRAVFIKKNEEFGNYSANYPVTVS